MRKFPIFILLLLMLPLTFGLEECKRVQEQDGIPCRVTTTWQPPNACNTYMVQVFQDQGVLIENITLSTFGSSGFCQFTFTHNSLGSYPYNITNGDTGNVNVIPNEEAKMLSVIIGFIFIIATLIFIGVVGQTITQKFVPFALALIEFFILVFILYASQVNGDIANLMRINFISILIAGGFFGFINLYNWIKHMVDMNNDIEDEEVKWTGNDKWGR